jgi:hypothetical protein
MTRRERTVREPCSGGGAVSPRENVSSRETVLRIFCATRPASGVVNFEVSSSSFEIGCRCGNDAVVSRRVYRRPRAGCPHSSHRRRRPGIAPSCLGAHGNRMTGPAILRSAPRCTAASRPSRSSRSSWRNGRRFCVSAGEWRATRDVGRVAKRARNGCKPRDSCKVRATAQSVVAECTARFHLVDCRLLVNVRGGQRRGPCEKGRVRKPLREKRWREKRLRAKRQLRRGRDVDCNGGERAETAGACRNRARNGPRRIGKPSKVTGGQQPLGSRALVSRAPVSCSRL